MRKISMLCLVLAASLYSFAAQSRICFLLDLECQEGLAKVDQDSTKPCAQKNPNWVRSNERCGYRIYKDVCNDTTDNYYEEGTCADGYTDMRLSENENYECTSNPVCGCCKDEDVVCKDKFKKCVSPTEPSVTAETCVEPGKDASETKYTSCICDTSVYKYNQTNCGKESFKLAGEKCSGDNGEWYTQCTCAEGYKKTTIADIKCPEDCEYGCSSVGNKAEDKLPDSKYYCWSGANCASKPSIKDPCPDPKSDFDKYWVGYDVNSNCRNLTVDCAELGYTTGTAASGVKCKDKSEPHRCMFDHTKVFCASGLCLYVNEADCERINEGWDCEPDPYDPDDYQDCYIPSKCKTGYYLSYSGKSCFECDYTDLATCESENPNSVCSYKTEGCYNLEGCKVSAYKAVDSCGTTGGDGYKLVNVDGNGCGVCQAKTCPTDTSIKADICVNKGKYSNSKDTTYYQGDKVCKECVCEAPASCEWTGENKGTATIADKCCNGKYETCTSSCVAVNVPTNATATATCTGCNETVDTAWKCNANYCKSGGSCQAICDYQYTTSNQPANSVLSGNTCTGYKETSEGDCTGSSETRYSSFTCKSGYCKKTTYSYGGGTGSVTTGCVELCSSSYKYARSDLSDTANTESCSGYYSEGDCALMASTKYKCKNGYTYNLVTKTCIKLSDGGTAGGAGDGADDGIGRFDCSMCVVDAAGNKGSTSIATGCYAADKGMCYCSPKYLCSQDPTCKQHQEAEVAACNEYDCKYYGNCSGHGSGLTTNTNGGSGTTGYNGLGEQTSNMNLELNSGASSKTNSNTTNWGANTY